MSTERPQRCQKKKVAAPIFNDDFPQRNSLERIAKPKERRGLKMKALVVGGSDRYQKGLRGN